MTHCCASGRNFKNGCTRMSAPVLLPMQFEKKTNLPFPSVIKITVISSGVSVPEGGCSSIPSRRVILRQKPALGLVFRPTSVKKQPCRRLFPCLTRRSGMEDHPRRERTESRNQPHDESIGDAADFSTPPAWRCRAGSARNDSFIMNAKRKWTRILERCRGERVPLAHPNAGRSSSACRLRLRS